MQNYFQFEPRINDFGDNYHVPDDELFKSQDEMIRNIRRKYRTYNEYRRAMYSIEKYLDNLVEKYGGLNNFKMALQLGNVIEFIPPIPKFRKTAENTLLSKYGVMLSDKVTEYDYDIPDDLIIRIENAEEEFGKGMKVKGVKVIPEVFGNKEITKYIRAEEHIARELEMLTNFAKHRITNGGNVSSKGHRNLNKALRKHRKTMLKCQYEVGISDMIKEYNDDICDKNANKYDPTDIRMYRGIMIPGDEFNALQLNEVLQKSGFIADDDYKSIGNKKLRKLVKANNKGKSKKKTKKKKKKDAMDKFVSDYTDSDHNSFEAFENEMQNFVSDKIRDLD